MSAFCLYSTDDEPFLYGFNAYKQEYFVIQCCKGNAIPLKDDVILVGLDCGVSGTWNNMFKALVKHKCIPPEKQFIAMMKTVGPTEEVVGRRLYRNEGCNPIDNMWLDEMHRWNTENNNISENVSDRHDPS